MCFSIIYILDIRTYCLHLELIFVLSIGLVTYTHNDYDSVLLCSVYKQLMKLIHLHACMIHSFTCMYICKHLMYMCGFYVHTLTYIYIYICKGICKMCIDVRMYICVPIYICMNV